MPVLGFDVGSVRVGLAASDPSDTLASMVATLRANGGDALWRAVGAVILERGCTRIVVGLPRRMDGGEGPAAGSARRFADEARRRTGLPVEMWDERLTTVEAERTLIARGVRRERRRQMIDGVAATVMLQSWLDAAGNR
jgi:putative Holliday junction resolvase